MNTRAHIFVEGRVQGVFFRDNTRRKALSLGLRGWVRNTRDGRVEIVVEGPQEAVERLIEWCHVGPPYAEVTKVSAEREEFRGEFSDFTIRWYSRS